MTNRDQVYQAVIDVSNYIKQNYSGVKFRVAVTKVYDEHVLKVFVLEEIDMADEWGGVKAELTIVDEIPRRVCVHRSKRKKR